MLNCEEAAGTLLLNRVVAHWRRCHRQSQILPAEVCDPTSRRSAAKRHGDDCINREGLFRLVYQTIAVNLRQECVQTCYFNTTLEKRRNIQDLT